MSSRFFGHIYIDNLFAADLTIFVIWHIKEHLLDANRSLARMNLCKQILYYCILIGMEVCDSSVH